jgi:hypothetical protein
MKTRLLTVSLSLLAMTGCASNELNGAEKLAMEKRKICTSLAMHTYNGDLFNELSTLKEIRDRGLGDSECQHYYEVQLNKYEGGSWVRKLKTLGKEYDSLEIDKKDKGEEEKNPDDIGQNLPS